MKTIIKILLITGIYTFLAAKQNNFAYFAPKASQQTAPVAHEEQKVASKVTVNQPVVMAQVSKQGEVPTAPESSETILIEVSKSGKADFTSLSEAVNFINNGKNELNYTIMMDSGRYDEPSIKLRKGKKIEIHGKGISETFVIPNSNMSAMFEYCMELKVEGLRVDGLGKSVSAFRSMNGAVRMSLEDVSMLHFQEGVTTNLSAGNKGGNIYLDRVEFAEMSGHPIRLEASSDVKLNLEANGVVIVTTKEICRGVLISGQNVNANFNVFCSHKNPNIPGTPYVVLDGAKINLQEEHFSGFNNGAEVAGVK